MLVAILKTKTRSKNIPTRFPKFDIPTVTGETTMVDEFGSVSVQHLKYVPTSRNCLAYFIYRKYQPLLFIQIKRLSPLLYRPEFLRQRGLTLYLYKEKSSSIIRYNSKNY